MFQIKCNIIRLRMFSREIRTTKENKGLIFMICRDKDG